MVGTDAARQAMDEFLAGFGAKGGAEGHYRTELEALVASLAATAIDRWEPADLEAHLHALREAGVSLPRQRVARVVGERFLRFVAQRRGALTDDARAEERLATLAMNAESETTSSLADLRTGRRRAPLEVADDGTVYARGFINPVGCMLEAFGTVRDQYLMLVALFLVGGLGISTIVLAPAAVAGLVNVVGARHRGERVGFGHLVEGFYWALSIAVVLLVHLLVGAFALATLYLVLVSLMAALAALEAKLLGLGLVAASSVMAAGLLLYLNNLYLFAYPLVVHRKMGPFRALALAARAGRTHWFGLSLLSLIAAFLLSASSVVPVIGTALVMPVIGALLHAAYVRVFLLKPKTK